MAKHKILLQGYIGHQNFGDDLLFDIAISKLKRIPDAEIFVIITDSNLNPDYLYSYHADLKIIRFEESIPLLYYKKFDKVYFIGGGVFFDYKKELNKKQFYKKFISNFIRYRIPKLFGTRYAGIGIGIGPYFLIDTKKLHAQIIRNFDILGVRDQTSFDLANSMGYRNAFLSNDISIELNESVRKKQNIDDKRDEVIICSRTYSHKPEYEKHIDELILFAIHLEKNGYHTHWVFLQKDSHEVTKRLAGQFKVTIWNPFEMSILDFINIFKKGIVSYTSRMHSIYISGMVRTPFVAIPLHQKLKFASNLFYKEPIFIDPLASQKEYLEAFTEISSKSFSTAQIDKEIVFIEELNKKVNDWLRS